MYFDCIIWAQVRVVSTSFISSPSSIPPPPPFSLLSHSFPSPSTEPACVWYCDWLVWCLPLGGVLVRHRIFNRGIFDLSFKSGQDSIPTYSLYKAPPYFPWPTACTRLPHISFGLQPVQGFPTFPLVYSLYKASPHFLWSTACTRLPTSFCLN